MLRTRELRDRKPTSTVDHMRLRSRSAERAACAKKLPEFNLSLLVRLEMLGGLQKDRKFRELWNAAIVARKEGIRHRVAKADRALSQIVANAE